MSQEKVKTVIWIVRDASPLPSIVREESVLGTDELIFRYGDTTVCRSRGDALSVLQSELEALRHELSSRLAHVTQEIEAMQREER